MTAATSTTATSTTATATGAEPVSTRPRSRILVSLAILALAAGAFTISSLALFTDQEANSGNAFNTGSVDIVTNPATAVITMPAMAPGDEVTAPLTITNSGSLDFRYAMTSTTTEDVLAAGLVLTVRESVATCDNANWDATGTQVYAGVLGTSGTTNVLGSNAQGLDAGDRTLAAGTNEVLCFNVTLPLNVANTVQGLATSATFGFDAEQVRNNP